MPFLSFYAFYNMGLAKKCVSVFHNFLSCASLTTKIPFPFLACSFLSHLANHKLLFRPYIPGPYQLLMEFFFCHLNALFPLN